MKKADLITVAALAGTAYAGYKLISWFKKQSDEEKQKKEEYEKYKKEQLALKDYRKLIRDASTFNKHLDAHERNIAFDMLQGIWFEITDLDDYDKRQLDDDLDNLNTCLDILLGDDEVAIKSTIERELGYEEKRRVKAERDHELALVKAAGEKEVNLAKIAADAEKSKASTYSSAIKSGAELVKEVLNERNEKSED